MLAQGVGLHRAELLEPGTQRLRSRVDPFEQGARLLPQGLGILLLLLGLRARLPMSVQLLLGGCQALADRRELRIEPREHVGSGRELPLLVAQPLDLGRERPPVDLAEFGVLLQPRQAVEPFPDPSLLALHPGDPAAELAELGLDAARSRFERVDLGRVRPAEHVPAPIVDAVPVVLLVPLAGGLDLAGAGDRMGLAAELALIGAAGHVEAAGQLPLQPAVERAVGLDGQLAHQGVGVQAGRGVPVAPALGAGLAYPEIDEPSREVGLVDPARHPGVVRVGHQERQTEAAQQALRRPFPVAFFLAYLEDFADERHVRLRREVQRLAQGGAHGDLPGRDVAAAGPEALDLRVERVVLLPRPAEVDPVLGQLVAQLPVQRADVLGHVREAPPLREKRRIVRGRTLADAPREIGVAPRPALARLALLLEPADLRCQVRQPIAAFLRDGAPQPVRFQALGVAPLRLAPHPRVLSPPVLAEPLEALAQQVELVSREPGPQRLPAPTQLADLRVELGMAGAVGDERREQLDPALRLQHRFVGATQVVEMVDQGCDPRRHVERLQHVAAHELGEIAHRLHRDRLMEEIERLLVVDAEAPAEPGAVGREAAEQRNVRRAAQALAKLRDVRAEARELAGDGQGALGGHVQALGLALRSGDPEHLGEGHGLLVARVAKHAQDDRVGVVVAQRHGPGDAAERAAFGLVVAQNVGAQRAFPAPGASRLVVGRALRRHQQRGDRVHECGLPRADVAGEQAVAPVRLQGPHAPVERAPVEHLETMQAVAGERVVVQEIEVQNLRFSHCRACRRRPRRLRACHDTRRAARRARRATGRPRMP